MMNEDYYKQQAEKFEMMILLMNRHTFGYREAAKIVGSRLRLDKLIGQGRIRAEKKSLSQNGKIYCNAGDVLRHAEFKF